MDNLAPALKDQVQRKRVDMLFEATAEQAYGTSFEVSPRPFKNLTDALSHAKNTG